MHREERLTPEEVHEPARMKGTEMSESVTQEEEGSLESIESAIALQNPPQDMLLIASHLAEHTAAILDVRGWRMGFFTVLKGDRTVSLSSGFDSLVYSIACFDTGGDGNRFFAGGLMWEDFRLCDLIRFIERGERFDSAVWKHLNCSITVDRARRDSLAVRQRRGAPYAPADPKGLDLPTNIEPLKHTIMHLDTGTVLAYWPDQSRRETADLLHFLHEKASHVK